jgi:hypothetical protein
MFLSIESQDVCDIISDLTNNHFKNTWCQNPDVHNRYFYRSQKNEQLKYDFIFIKERMFSQLTAVHTHSELQTIVIGMFSSVTV